VTINELLVLIKAVRERRNDLISLRDKNSITTRWMTDEKKVEEPQYDPKNVDKKVSELDLFLLKADAKIKQSNARVEIEIDAEADKLLAPIE